MKTCLRVPRLFLPKKDFEKWAVPAPGAGTGDPEFWERVAREIGDAPSALSFAYPESLGGGEERDVRSLCYDLIEDRTVWRLDRGCVLVERTTAAGVRRGILACADLEEFSPAGGKDFMIRPVEEADESEVLSRLAVREGALLEFPSAVLCYKDKRDKFMRSLEGEDLERLYEFDLLAGGGRVSGYFLPEYIAIELLHDLTARADPCFGVLDGVAELVAAKRYWEKIKEKLPAREARVHPSRFALCEFVNLSDDAVVLEGADKTEAISALKTGKLLPAHTLAFGKGTGRRYLLEGREISYD